MSSSESDYARRMARNYGPELARLLRPERLARLQARIETLNREMIAEGEAHKQTCERCRDGDFCLARFSLSKTDRERHDDIVKLKGFIGHEERDQQYADKARQYGVDYQHHIDGFCCYWQNVRYRKFVSVDWQCESCGTKTAALQCHHRHYETLGFEEITDLEALCERCHRARHPGRQR